MNLVADMLLQHLESDHQQTIKASRLCPPMRRRLTSTYSLANGGSYSPVRRANRVVRTLTASAFNGDRFFNRFWDYPRWLRMQLGRFDLFHVVDHSYAQLVHQLPPERTIVTCHDLDAFRCLLRPGSGRLRWTPRRAMASRILAGLRKAALVVCDSAAIRDELLSHELLSSERVVVVPIGVHPTCKAEPDPQADTEASRLLGPASADQVDILHVGSTIARKRIDVLLRVFGEVRKEFPQARLIRVGGPFTPAQNELAEQLQLNGSVLVTPLLERDVLSAIYRRASLVLQPSESEGFGLPVVEAMACGTQVVASDLSALREVGGEATVYCPPGDVRTWSERVIELLNEKSERPELWNSRRAKGVEQASNFSWAEYTGKMVSLYERLLSTAL